MPGARDVAMPRRLLVLIAALLGATAGPAAAQATPVVFTVAGGGSQRPAPGVVATRARLGIVAAAALADGSTLLLTHEDDVITAGRRPQPLWRIDAAGILRPIPALPEAAAVAATPDGTAAWAVAQPTGSSAGATRILRLDAAGSAPRQVADLRDRLSDVTALVGLDDGSVVATNGVLAFRITPDGAVAPAAPRRPGRAPSAATLAQPGGAILQVDGRGGARRVARDGTVSPVALRLGSDVPLSSTADGTVIAGHASTVASGLLIGTGDGLGTVTLHATDGTATSRRLVGPRPGLGDGDGGPPATMRIAVRAAAPTPAGGLLLVDAGSGSDAPVAYQQSAATRLGDRLRLVAAAPAPAATAAFAANVPASWPSGRVPVLTGGPGRVRLTIRTPGGGPRVVLAAVTGGRAQLRVPRRLPAGPADLTLDFAGADGSRVRARAHVDSTPRLTISRARRTADGQVALLGEGDEGGGSSYRAGRCVRRSRFVVACTVFERLYDDGGSGEFAVERRTVRLRPDGLHVRVSAR